MSKRAVAYPPPSTWPASPEPEPAEEGQAGLEAIIWYEDTLANIEEYFASQKRRQIVRRHVLLRDHVDEITRGWFESRRVVAVLETLLELPEVAKARGIAPELVVYAYLSLYGLVRRTFRAESRKGRWYAPSAYNDGPEWEEDRRRIDRNVRGFFLAALDRRERRFVDDALEAVALSLDGHPDGWRRLVLCPSEHDDLLDDFEGEPDPRLGIAVLRPSEERTLLCARLEEERAELQRLAPIMDEAVREDRAFEERMCKTEVAVLGPLVLAIRQLEESSQHHFLRILLTIRLNELEAAFAETEEAEVDASLVATQRRRHELAVPLPQLWEFWFVALHGILRASGGLDDKGKLAGWAIPTLDALLRGPKRLNRAALPAQAAKARALLVRNVTPWIVAEAPGSGTPGVGLAGDEVLAGYARRLAAAACARLDSIGEIDPTSELALAGLAADFVIPNAHALLMAMVHAWITRPTKDVDGDPTIASPEDAAPETETHDVSAEDRPWAQADRERARRIAARMPPADWAAARPAAVDARTEFADVLESPPAITWSFVRDPLRTFDAGTPVGTADPGEAQRFEDQFRKEGIDPLIKVESIVRALRYYESLPFSARHILPREVAAGQSWTKLKRGRLRILIHAGSDGDAQFHVYQRKEYKGALEFLKA